ncbi:phosphodiester glycosidase family protein [Pelomonas sp. KK5]|uniref:phosphodiester glycosidase family protein n=1 Tax=Pelomonas sp. KK5 TaxID=1855730 RepID=UPI00097C5F1D|nr:phosphodiester glycosidase family protein [Pelomonas sp. KK5]
MKTMMKRLAMVAAALLLAACAQVGPSQPPLAWQQRTPGLAYLQFSPLKDSVVHVLRVDLRSPGIQVLLSAQAERGEPMSEMQTAIDSLAGVNASFFTKDYTPVGWTLSNGETWLARLETETSPLLVCDVVPSCEIRLHGPFAHPEPRWRTAVAGKPWLVDEGRARTPADDAACSNAGFCAKPHPRTAVGLDAEGRFMFLVVAEGRRPPVAGLTLAELAGVMQQQLGVRTALNLDGGGSSTLWLDGKGINARPLNEPAMRAVANALLVRQQMPLK